MTLHYVPNVRVRPQSGLWGQLGLQPSVAHLFKNAVHPNQWLRRFRICLTQTDAKPKSNWNPAIYYSIGTLKRGKQIESWREPPDRINQNSLHRDKSFCDFLVKGQRTTSPEVLNNPTTIPVGPSGLIRESGSAWMRTGLCP